MCFTLSVPALQTSPLWRESSPSPARHWQSSAETLSPVEITHHNIHDCWLKIKKVCSSAPPSANTEYHLVLHVLVPQLHVVNTCCELPGAKTFFIRQFPGGHMLQTELRLKFALTTDANNITLSFSHNVLLCLFILWIRFSSSI